MSGIYIPGISMPTNCSECAFCGYYGNGEHMCDIIQKAVEYESAKMSRLDDCPLVPVPPHGRLIDADALCNRLEKAGKIKPYLESGLNVAISFALTAPTIIPAEEGT